MVQVLVRNALADPFLLGVSFGASYRSRRHGIPIGPIPPYAVAQKSFCGTSRGACRSSLAIVCAMPTLPEDLVILAVGAKPRGGPNNGKLPWRFCYGMRGAVLVALALAGVSR